MTVKQLIDELSKYYGDNSVAINTNMAYEYKMVESVAEISTVPGNYDDTVAHAEFGERDDANEKTVVVIG